MGLKITGPGSTTYFKHWVNNNIKSFTKIIQNLEMQTLHKAQYSIHLKAGPFRLSNGNFGPSSTIR
jgi:hypothetical protein